ncbi:zinc finger protein 624-like, partial [Vespula squamosa]
VKMFGEGAMWDDYGNNNEDKGKEEPPERLVVDVDIPLLKIEPMSPARSNSCESLQSPSQLPIVTPLKLKDPIILLEKCDKIWETLKLIKNVQSTGSENTINHSIEKIDLTNLTVSSPKKDPEASYIIYQPVLGNNNSALPNFKFSVKSTKKLFHCNVCGKEYSENRSLRSHSEKIHGIYIPPKRKYNKSKYKEISSEYINSDLTAPLTNGTKTNENHFQAEKKNNLLDKEMAHTRCGYRAKCPLCKRTITDLHRHLTDYHKIGCPNLVMKELESNALVSANISLQDLTKAMVNTMSLYEVSDNENTIISEQMTQKKIKLNENEILNVENASENLQTEVTKFKCEICFGVYASYNSFYKHSRIHRRRGETKNNFNAFKCRYLNSPLNPKRTELLLSTSNSQNQEKTKRISLDSIEGLKSQDQEYNSYNNNSRTRANKKYLDRLCICGRSFRDYHTLVLHKNTCKFKDTSETESFTEDNPDRDSGSGINIKIKKKNDSYEIVSKDSGDENKSKDSGHPYDCDTPSDISDLIFEDCNEVCQENHSLNILKSSKYSKDHSILKIKTINENTDIDVDESSRNISLNKNKENKQINKNMQIRKIQEQKGNVEVVPTYLCETIMTEQSEMTDDSNILKTKQRPIDAENSTDFIKSKEEKSIETAEASDLLKRKKENLIKIDDQKLLSNTSMYVNTICPCGESFQTLKSCNTHIAKCHPLFLRCGYCVEKFNSIGEYNNHRCNVKEGKKFSELHTDMSCPFCHAVVRNKSEFDKHIKFQHFDPELPYQCHECTQKFPSSTGCQLHFQRVHGKCVCNVCGTKLTSAAKLRHEGYHYGLGFPCHICKKTHSNRKHLLNHFENIHEETDKLMTCNICLQSVKKKSYSWHIYSHKTVTTCKLCKKVYCDARTLEHHIISSHKGKYPWIKCNFCTRKFSNKKLLETHIKKEKCNRYLLQVQKKFKKSSKDRSLLHS